MRYRSRGLIGLAAAAGLLALLLAAGPDRPASTTPPSAAVRGYAPTTPAKEQIGAAAREESGLMPAKNSHAAVEPLPSHEGTTIDGGVHFDVDGNVVPDLALRRLFEYFLTGLGRDDITGLRTRLEAALRARDFPPQAITQVLALFDRYLEYRTAMAELPAPGTDLAGLRTAFEARYALRREILGPVMAEGFFAREEAEDRYVMERLALERDERLTPEERQRALRLLEQQLPEEIRRARERSRLAITLAERTRELREAGAGEAELWALRAELAGPAAADRLAELDRRREVWQRRLEDYRRERDRILASPGLAEADKRAAIDALIEARFDELEARRVRALDALDAYPLRPSN